MLELKDISLTFGNKMIFNHLNFHFEDKHVYVIRGESGKGKTTLLNVITDYVRPDSGEVLMDKQDCLGYLYQDETLFSNLTVRENLFIKFAAASRSFEFESLIRHILQSLKVGDLIDRKVELLSGGERQRIQIASMLLDDPNIILMDEPTSKLDSENSGNIMDIIKNTFQEKTVIIVTHEDIDYGENSVSLVLENGGLILEQK